MSITKTKKIVIKSKITRKTNFIRLTITPDLEQKLQIYRPKYPFLDDSEILKIWLGNGVNKEIKDDLKRDYSKNKDWGLSLNEPTDREMLNQASNIFQLDEDWSKEPDNIDYTKAKPINWDNFSF